MSFRVTLTLSETELGKVLALLTKQQLAGVEILPAEPQAKATKTGAVRPAGVPKSPLEANRAIIMRGDRNDEPTAPAAIKMLALHEKLEAKYGIGNVTRGELSEACKKTNLSRHAIGTLLQGGWLVYVIGG